MLALGIRYLNGFVAASEPDIRERVEWPPHPGRVFLALAAAHFQTGGDGQEREALLWIERLPPPAVHAAVGMPRAAVTHYVPVNDKAGPSRALLQSAPIPRDRQPRTFARAWVEDQSVFVVWPGANPAVSMREALGRLCSKVTRIGHSSSLVQMWVADVTETIDPNWVPDDYHARIHLRIAGPGTLEDLERRYNREAVETFATLQVDAIDGSLPGARSRAKRRLKEEFGDEPPPRHRPVVPIYQGYAPSSAAVETMDTPPPPATIFSPHLIVFRLEREAGPHSQLDLACATALARRWREALVSLSTDLSERTRALISGHDAAGAPSTEPHVAFVPLAFVGHPHADGHLLGAALALPRGVRSDERHQVLRAAGRVQQLKLGPLGVWRVDHEMGLSPPWNLRPEAWTGSEAGATHWSSVTPVVLDRHPKSLDRWEHQRELCRVIEKACQAIDLPRPAVIVPVPVAAHLGVPPAHAFPRLGRKDGSLRRHTHAILIFDRPVRGPILLGAGRYLGYGLFRPIGDTT